MPSWLLTERPTPEAERMVVLTAMSYCPALESLDTQDERREFVQNVLDDLHWRQYSDG